MSMRKVSFLLILIGCFLQACGQNASAPSVSCASPDTTSTADPLAAYAWFLNNSGQTCFAKNPGTVGIDLNMSDTLSAEIFGTGIRIAVSDTGVEILHEDLSDNILSGENKDYGLASPYLGDPTPPTTGEAELAHGTSVAGLIAAVKGNSKGSFGIASAARLAGFLYIGVTPSAAIDIDQANGSFDIFNYSYGASSCTFDPLAPSLVAQFKYGVNSLRSGKGAIYVKAAGNEYVGDLSDCLSIAAGEQFYFGNAAVEGYHAYPYLLVVAATNAKGKSASYSSPGSSVWISAPGGEFGDDDPAMLTTDLSGCAQGISQSTSTTNSFETNPCINSDCKYTSRMNGTSSAVPLISGAIALMLEAKSTLTWRDVKHILATTANQVDPTAASTGHPTGENLTGHVYQQGWITNAAGYKFHNWYGFGGVNVDALVQAAQSYSTNLGVFVETLNPNTDAYYYDSGSISVAIPDLSSAGASTVAAGATSSITVLHELKIEAVQVAVSLTHSSVGELGIELTSPSGTKSILTNINSGLVDNGLSNALLLSNAFYGEDSYSGTGSWTLKVIDGKSGTTGTLTGWKINIYGHKNSAPTDSTAPSAVASVTHAATNNSLTTTPAVSWVASVSTDVLRYEYSIGSTAGATDILPWESAGAATSATRSGLSLTLGNTYFFNVRVVDTSENVSSSTSSTGWLTN